MKNALLFSLLFVCIASAARADWVIVQKTKAMGQEQPMTFKIKGSYTRMDIGADTTVIMDTTAGTTEMILHQQKMVMRMDKDGMKAMGSAAGALLGAEKAAAPKATGEKVKVGEWETEVYTWEGKLGAGRFFVAKNFPDYEKLSKLMDSMTKAMPNPMQGQVPTNADFPGMVVKTEMKVKIMGQEIESIVELISAKEETVDPTVFKVPAGYTEMKMPNIPGVSAPGK